MRESNSSTKHRTGQARRLPKCGRWSRLFAAIAIATMPLCLTACVSSSADKITEPCLKEAVTYGDVVECAIRLDELYNGD